MSGSTYETGTRTVEEPVRRHLSPTTRTVTRRRSSTTCSPPRCGTSYGPALPHLLSGVEPAAGPILDLGAGTGAGTVHLHAAFPDASIVAVEPSKAMRTALNVRLANNAGLRQAVTVMPCTFEDADLPRSPRWVCWRPP